MCATGKRGWSGEKEREREGEREREMTKYHHRFRGSGGYEGTTMKPRASAAGAQPQQYKSAMKAILAGVFAAVVVFVVIASLTRSNLTSARALLSTISTQKAASTGETTSTTAQLINTGEKGTASLQSVYTDIPILDIDKKVRMSVYLSSLVLCQSVSLSRERE